MWILRLKGMLANNMKIQYHYRRYERDELKNILENNGFKILEFWSYGFIFLNNMKIQ